MAWRQEGSRFILNSHNTFFEMPKGYNLSDVHPDLLKLSEYLLLYRWYPNILDGYTFSRKGGSRIGLLYSGGVDSVAAHLILPKGNVDLVWNKEDQSQIRGSAGNLTNAAHAMAQTAMRDGVRVFEVLSNQHHLPKEYGRNAGFSSPLAVCVPAILLADYLDFGYLSSGTVIESTYMHPQGRSYADFTKAKVYREAVAKLNACGLQFTSPTIGMSEITTLQIVEKSHLSDIAKSCTRGTEVGEVCGKCIKCFRKGDAEFEDLPSKLQDVIRMQPPKMWSSLAQRLFDLGNWYGHIPSDVSFLNNTFYPKALESCEPFKDEIIANLASYGVRAMNEEEIKMCENFEYKMS